MTTGGQGSTSRLETAGAQDPTESASRNHAARRRREIAESYAAVSHNDAMQSIYEERAARKEAEQREADRDAHYERVARERREQEESLRPFLVDDPNPHPFGLPSPDDPENDIFDAYTESLEWEK